MSLSLSQRFKSPFIELLTTLKWYRRFPAFTRLDLRLKRAYGLLSPYSLARSKKHKTADRFSESQPPFGHTPLKALEEIAKLAGIKKGDAHFLSLAAATQEPLFG